MARKRWNDMNIYFVLGLIIGIGIGAVLLDAIHKM
jgi:hypothetical protein